MVSEKEQKKFKKYVQTFRGDFIPKKYNQIKLMDYLLNDEIDHYISISNRADGKSFNYCHFILRLAVEHNIGFTFVVRNFTVRDAGQKLFQKIIDVMNFNANDFTFMRTEFYIALIYRDRYVGLFTDLNKATDLKYQSNFLADFPIIIYDEFLALDGDYLIDEWDRLKTIYGSINRNENIPLIKIPKIIYLGNAVNFSSPILSNLNLFNILENHKMNTVKQYDNIVLELNKNDNANERRNLRAFNEEQDNMTKAEFNVNNYAVATETERNRINKNPAYIYIKLGNNYLKVIYNVETYETILTITSYNDYYDFNLLMKDNRETSIYLDDTFFSPEFHTKYIKGIYLFDNNYSKDFILDSMNNLKNLRINKVIKQHIANNTFDNFERNEKVYQENYIQNTKKALVEKFLL